MIKVEAAERIFVQEGAYAKSIYEDHSFQQSVKAYAQLSMKDVLLGV